MFSLREIAELCDGKIVAKDSDVLLTGFAIDSREVRAGDLFVAFQGAHVDGHDFIHVAFRNGARAALVEHEIPGVFPLVVVPHVLTALQNLARTHRKSFNLPVVCVTGSCGKTTTKECLGIALSRAFRVRTGFRNWNNELGVPLNLLNLKRDDECLVLELGAGKAGDIAFLADLAKPNVGVLTGVHPVHLNGFSNLDGVYEGKLELADEVNRNGGMMIVNGDDPELVNRMKLRGGTFLTYGKNKSCNFFLSNLLIEDGVISFQVNQKHCFRLRGYGEFNAMNALAAIAAAAYYKIDLDELSKLWCALPTIEKRFQRTLLHGFDIELIDDSYNANPYSVQEAFSSFLNVSRGRRRIVVFGDMLELGTDSLRYHEDVGRMIAKSDVTMLIGVGEMAAHAVTIYQNSVSESSGIQVMSVREAASVLLPQLLAGDSVLIKGSHGTHLFELKSLLEKGIVAPAAI